MPDSLHPPYNITQPRTLQRWLDVNPQNGPLKRTQKYLTIPAFSVAHTWGGASTIIGAYNFAGSNAFSLVDLSTIPSDLNFLLAVMYVNADLTVVRYKLNSVDESSLDSLQQYVNERIKKYFRFEIWSTNSTPAVLSEDIVLLTSVRGDVDYRYGEDEALNNTEEMDTALGAPLPGPVPIVFDNVLYINED